MQCNYLKYNYLIFRTPLNKSIKILKFTDSFVVNTIIRLHNTILQIQKEV